MTGYARVTTAIRQERIDRTLAAILPRLEKGPATVAELASFGGVPHEDVKTALATLPLERTPRIGGSRGRPPYEYRLP